MPTIIECMFYLQIKHFLIDWFLQFPYEYKNKGTYGHWGGISHAFKNGFGTAICFSPWVDFSIFLLIMFIDTLVHYHIDYCKMNINKIMEWTPTSHEEFWWLTGFEQYLHQLTYIILVLSFIQF